MEQVETHKHLNVSTSIKTVEDLSKSILSDPDKTESFHKFIEEKYGLESHQEILNVTHDELEGLKNEIQSGNTNFENIGKLVYEDYVETQLETQGLEGVSLNIVTNGIETPRLNEIKQEFEAYFDNAFKSYDFISGSQKELFKISIVNKLLDSQLSSVGTDMMGSVSKKITGATKSLQEGEYSEAISSVTDTSEFSEGSDIMKTSLDTCMKNYTDKLDSIQILIQSKYPEYNLSQLQNVFSNINEFKDPSFIENNIDSFDINTIDFTQSEIFNTKINTENIKEYILNSRENISDVADKLSQGDKMQEFVLDLISDKNFGGAMKGFLSILMKLPIIGDMISTFLGLDKKTPMASLEKLSGKYNFLNGLLGQGKSESKNGKEEGKGIFKNINFGEQSFQENKGIIGKIMTELPKLDEKALTKFWQDSFSKNGLQIKGVSLKFHGLDDLDNFENGVMKQGVLNNLLKRGFSDYENDLGGLEVAEKQKKQAELEKVKNDKMNILENNKIGLEKGILEKNTKIAALSNMLSDSQMNEIDDWDDWFNLGDITDISLSEIKKSKNSQEAVKLIEEELGDEISDDNKLQLTELCNQIKLYLTTNNLDKEIKTIGDLYDNSSDKSKLFFDYVSRAIKLTTNELEELQENDKKNAVELEKLGVNSTKEELMAKELLLIEEGRLSEGVKFGKYTLKYNPENGELLVGENKYILYYNEETENNFSDIIIDKGIISFNLGLIKKTVNKISVLSFLQDSIMSSKEESIFTSGDSKITLKKQA